MGEPSRRSDSLFGLFVVQFNQDQAFFEQIICPEYIGMVETVGSKFLS